MLNTILTFLSVLSTAARRLRANVGLALCALIALLAAVALAVSIPVYAEAANLRVLRDEIVKQEQRTGRTPFALLFRYVGSWNGPMEWNQVKAVDGYLRGPGIQFLGLPVDGIARHARTSEFSLFPPPSQSEDNQALKNVMLGFLGGLDEQIRVVDGAVPTPATSIDQPVEVLIAYELANQVGINVGDEFRVVAPAGSGVVAIPIRVAGLWQPNNAQDPGWFFPPESFNDVILLPETTFSGPLAEALKGEVAQVVWFARLNGTGLTTTTAPSLLGRIEAVRAQSAGAVPGLKLEQSPAEALTRYQTESAALTRQLLVFGAPILTLVLYFVALVAALLVNRQRGEIALLKTRGVRDLQIVGIYITEWCLLGAVALGVGPFVGLLFARAMGQTRSFLRLASDAPPLPIELTWSHLRFGVVAAALALVAALVPAFVAARRTLVDEQQSASRTQRPPLWQRLFLDFLLLLPAVYGLYQLRVQGGLQLGRAQGAGQAVAGQTNDVLTNPLLVLVPVLLCFSLGLIALRLIPLLLELLARLATIPSWTAPLVGLRALARQPGAYRGPLLLLILTLSLAAFSASIAATLDGAMERAISYQIGAHTQLLETGQSTEQPSNPGGPGQNGSQSGGRKNIEDEARFLFVPVSEHLTVPGVQAATRVGTYEAMVQVGGNKDAQLVGIDRLEFPKTITHFDEAWANGQSLGALMNLLARHPDGVVVSRDILANGLKIGDVLPTSLTLFGDRRDVQFTIVAAVDLWPGFYPQDGPIIVANLNYIFDQMGGQYPYDVWIARESTADVNSILGGVRRLGITVVDARDAQTLIAEEQTQPRRQGLFGLLSVGFITAGVLTILGFLLAALISARKRAIELGVLRALGLSGAQVAVALLVEQVLLVAVGVGAGTGIGLLVAVVAVPLFQVGVGPYPGTPAFPPQIAWTEVQVIYVIFALALALTLLGLAWVLRRMQLFQAVKLGDAN